MAPQPPDLPEQAASAAIRVATLEQRVAAIQLQLAEYGRAREIDLQFQNLRDQLLQIKQEQSDIKKDQAEIAAKLNAQELAAQQRDNLARASQDKLQIRVLVGIVSAIATLVTGYALYILTHLHP